MTNLTCLGIDPPGRTSQSKAATLSTMSTALSFCMYMSSRRYVYTSFNFLGVLPGTWSSDVAWASVMRNWMREIHGRLWGRVTKDSRKWKPNSSLPSTACPPFSPCRLRPSKRGSSPPTQLPNLSWWPSILRESSTILRFWDTDADLPIFFIAPRTSFFKVHLLRLLKIWQEWIPNCYKVLMEPS